MVYGKIPSFMKAIFDIEFKSNLSLQKYLSKINYKKLQLIGYGKSSWIINIGDKYTIKLEKKSSTRIEMAKKEAENLKFANKHDIGPKLIYFETEFVVYEYINAIPLKKFILESNETLIKKCIDCSLKQAEKLDEIGLDHGQIAGDGTNIIVKENGKPIIVDFEKSSQIRKPHNYNRLYNLYFNGNTKISKKILEFISPPPHQKIDSH